MFRKRGIIIFVLAVITMSVHTLPRADFVIETGCSSLIIGDVCSNCMYTCDKPIIETLCPACDNDRIRKVMRSFDKMDDSDKRTILGLLCRRGDICNFVGHQWGDIAESSYLIIGGSDCVFRTCNVCDKTQEGKRVDPIEWEKEIK